MLLRTRRAWMPSDAKARPYDTAVSKFHSIAFIFFAMPSVLVPSVTLFGVSKSTCRVQELPPKYLVGWLLLTACSFLGLICLSVLWPSVGSSLFLVNYVGNPRIGSCVCRTVDHRTDFPRTMFLQDFQISLRVLTLLDS